MFLKEPARRRSLFSVEREIDIYLILLNKLTKASGYRPAGRSYKTVVCLITRPVGRRLCYDSAFHIAPWAFFAACIFPSCTNPYDFAALVIGEDEGVGCAGVEC